MFKRHNRGFTLVEMMVVVVLLTVFLGFGITSGSAIKDQLSFFRNQQVVAAQVYKARALAVATLNKDQVCGYGVEFNGGSVDIKPLGKPSQDYDCEGGALNWGGKIDLYSKGLEDGATANGPAIAFIAPIPTVRNSATVIVRVRDVCGSVEVNQFGQVKTTGSCN